MDPIDIYKNLDVSLASRFAIATLEGLARASESAGDQLTANRIREAYQVLYSDLVDRDCDAPARAA